MIRNSQAASSTVLPLIVIVMEVVSSKDLTYELDTVCCWARNSPVKNRSKSIVFFIAFEFIKKGYHQIASSIYLIHYG
jgi:hypothetical protein